MQNCETLWRVLDEVNSFSFTAPRLAIITQHPTAVVQMFQQVHIVSSPPMGLCRRQSYGLLAGEKAGLSAAGSPFLRLSVFYSPQHSNKQEGREKWRTMKQTYFVNAAAIYTWRPWWYCSSRQGGGNSWDIRRIDGWSRCGRKRRLGLQYSLYLETTRHVSNSLRCTFISSSLRSKID